MSGVKITNIDAIAALRDSVNEFSMEIPPRIKDIDATIAEALNQLHVFKEKVEYSLRTAETKLQNQNNRLTICLSRIETGENGNRIAPSCSSEKHAVNNAKRELDAARNCMMQMNELMRAVQSRLEEYNKTKEGFHLLVTKYAQKAASELGQIHKLASHYVGFSKLYDNV
jgi:hypothetical protein